MKLGILILAALILFGIFAATSNNTENTNETKPEATATPKPRLSDILNAGN